MIPKYLEVAVVTADVMVNLAPRLAQIKELFDDRSGTIPFDLMLPQADPPSRHFLWLKLPMRVIWVWVRYPR